MQQRTAGLLLILAFSAIAVSAQGKSATDYFAHMKTHSEVLKKWLASELGLRPAVAADAAYDDH
ncbi:MAG: hypothetical protein H0V76_04700 [Blastocatellia bacterium]|nr:hypothetical protein [Blastocatellia bacterium]